jgi:uncharacterized protein
VIERAGRRHWPRCARRARGFARGAALALALCGCAGSRVPSYYVLGAAMPAAVPEPAAVARSVSATDTPAPLVPPASGAAERTVIVLDEVRLPEWLDRPQMALQVGAGRLRVDADHRWGEPLGAGIERLIATQLRTARPGAWVALARSGGTLAPPNWRIAVVIDTVQMRPGGSLSAAVRWQCFPVGEPQGRPTVIDQAVFHSPLADAGPEALVNAWTRLSADLGQRIATGW